MRFSRIWVLVFAPMVLAATEGPRCPPAAAPADCTEDRNVLDEHFFIVKGKKMTIVFGHKHLHVICRSDVQLDSKALPRFAVKTVVPTVLLSACAPPAPGFANALLALNVEVGKVLVLEDVPVSPSLTAHHLSGLKLRGFQISAATEHASFLRPEPSFLDPLGMVFDLTLTRVALPSEAALRLPANLRALSLYDVGLSSLPAPVFARLPALVRLALYDSVLKDLDLSESPALGVVEVNAPLNGIALGPRVENATLQNVRSVELRGNCSGLRRLRVEGEGATLPSAWLAKCSVRELRLARLRPGALGADELQGAKDLQLLEVRGCGLRSLPPGWINSSTSLKTLDLSYNNIKSIPSEVITASPALVEVVLTDNTLNASAVGGLSAASLTVLMLDNNPLGDLCGVNVDKKALSALWEGLNLTRLYLRNTGAMRICPNWRQLPQLTSVDLRDNKITDLKYEDLQWLGGKSTIVNLRGNPVRRVTYTSEQYERALALPSQPAGLSPAPTLYLDSLLACDCGVYWFALTLRERPRHGQAKLKAVCGDGRALESVPTDELVCYLPQKSCPERCKCALVGKRSRVACPKAELVALPILPVASLLPPPAELLLPSNNITEINLASVTSDLEVLDLTDNLIKHIDAETVDALFADGRKVLLDGNPLSCDCRDTALQRALASRGKGGTSRERCQATAETKCSTELWLLLAAALLLIAAVTLGWCLVRPSSRRRIKVFLFEHGVCVHWALGASMDPASEVARDYDAFVSFSHRDAEYAEQLAERLERGPSPRRLCLHERDWTPGEWIPAQIASSVRRSRRTVALVSESFLASEWARAELREAYGAALREGRARLLAVLLPGLEPPRAAAAPELATYLAAVTYLRWDDPHFWEQLLVAVPPPPPAAPRLPGGSAPADAAPRPPSPPPRVGERETS